MMDSVVCLEAVEKPNSPLSQLLILIAHAGLLTFCRVHETKITRTTHCRSDFLPNRGLFAYVCNHCLLFKLGSTAIFMMNMLGFGS